MSHEFALNGNPQNPYCAGIQGVVQAYHSALQAAELWGPTNVAPIINHVARFAEQAAKKQDAQVSVCVCVCVCAFSTKLQALMSYLETLGIATEHSSEVLQ